MLRLEQSENNTRNQPDDHRPCQRRVNFPLGRVRHLTRRRFCEPALVESLTQHERSTVRLKVQVGRCTLNERADGILVIAGVQYNSVPPYWAGARPIE